jgi:hypothetical protein
MIELEPSIAGAQALGGKGAGVKGAAATQGIAAKMAGGKAAATTAGQGLGLGAGLAAWVAAGFAAVAWLAVEGYIRSRRIERAQTEAERSLERAVDTK